MNSRIAGMTSFPSAGPPRFVAFVPCAGVGARAGAGGPKQYVPVEGRALVLWTLDALARVPALSGIAVGVTAGDRTVEALVEGEALAGEGRTRLHDDGFLSVLPCGGDTRADTVGRGLAMLAADGLRDEDWVLVHDAARCLVDPAAVTALVEACRDDPVGGLLAMPIPDTLKHADAQGRVDATLDRTAKWAAQTPQMFRLGLLRQALEAARERGTAVTDESSAVEALGHAPRLVRGGFENLKVPWPEDFALAARLLRGVR